MQRVELRWPVRKTQRCYRDEKRRRQRRYGIRRRSPQMLIVAWQEREKEPPPPRLDRDEGLGDGIDPILDPGREGIGVLRGVEARSAFSLEAIAIHL
jgi:hypothetical protein